MPRPLPEGQGAAGSGNSFISKPARGWLHSDQMITKEGITYAVRYIGCLEILTSMKSLDFDTRSQVAKECINRVCEAAGLKTADKKRKVEKRVQRVIADQPKMEHAGANVNLTISSCSLVLTALESGRVIAGHDMPRISFASGGDTDTLDFVAYVAKDLKDWRACDVLECGGGLAQDVITTIGQAFELRFKEFLTRPSYVTSTLNGDDRDYYNDLPGKIPPELSPPPVPPLPNMHSTQTMNKPSASASTSSTLPREHQPVQQRDTNDRTVAREPFSSAMTSEAITPASQRIQLQKEIWFHGPVSRQEAEMLLAKDGDFRVRESQGSPGQYVLTGMQGGIKKHLLLVDPEGVVRTKDRMFESVSHLINYHFENELPIISAESALVLRRPVHRQQPS